MFSMMTFTKVYTVSFMHYSFIFIFQAHNFDLFYFYFQTFPLATTELPVSQFTETDRNKPKRSLKIPKRTESHING